MSADCLFCRFVRGEAHAERVFEDDRLLAFLDIGPIRPAHTQIIPKQHYVYFDDLPPDLAAAIIHLGQKLAVAMKRIYGVKRVAFLFTGGDIPHAHAHVVPMVSPVDITSRRYIAEEKLTWRDLPRLSTDELAHTGALLRSELDRAI